MKLRELFDNGRLRRQECCLCYEDAVELLRNGEYGHLSMVTPENTAYGIPVNYVWDGVADIYIHCATSGQKLQCLGAGADVSFCVVGPTRVIPRKFTANYESIVLKCRAMPVSDPGERMEALRLIVEKYAPEFKETGEKFAKVALHRTAIIRLAIIVMSGKRHSTGD